MSYTKGDRAHLDVTVKDRAGTLVDPTTIVLKVEDPTGFETTYTPTRDSLGKYSYDIDLDTAGEWAIRWESDGVGKAAKEALLVVNESRFA